jgi:hypothetical protein
MGIKRSTVGLVTLAVAVATLAAGLTAAPNVYYDMNSNPGAVDQIVTMQSGTTSVATPDVYYDM